MTIAPSGRAAFVLLLLGSRWQLAGQQQTPFEWTFDDVITTAIARHPLTEAARSRVLAARGERLTSTAFPNPVGTFWVDNTNSGGQLPIATVREISIYATLPLEPLFERGARIRRADAGVRAADAAFAAAGRQVAVDAAHAFFRQALAQASVAAAEETRAGLKNLVAYNESRVREGAAPGVDLIRAKVELDRAATDVVFAEVDLARSRAELWAFLGNEGSMPASFHLTIPSASPAGISLPPAQDLVKEALERRPDLIRARARVAEAAADVAYQRKVVVRQVDATFGFKNQSGDPTLAANNSLIAGLSVSLPLFNRNQGEIQRASGEWRAERQDLAWTERTATAEVNGIYDAACRLAAQVDALQTSFLTNAEEANRITFSAYQEGGATLLQVFDASRSLAQARLTFYRALLAERQARFDLALAAGEEPAQALTVLRVGSSPTGIKP